MPPASKTNGDYSHILATSIWKRDVDGWCALPRLVSGWTEPIWNFVAKNFIVRPLSKHLVPGCQFIDYQVTIYRQWKTIKKNNKKQLLAFICSTFRSKPRTPSALPPTRQIVGRFTPSVISTPTKCLTKNTKFEGATFGKHRYTSRTKTARPRASLQPRPFSRTSGSLCARYS